MKHNRRLILSKKDLKDWLAKDAVYYQSQTQSLFRRLKYILNSHAGNDQCLTWRYVRNLRYAEYHINQYGFFHILCRTIYLYRLRRLGYKTGFQIPPNVVGPGLNLPHYGSIIVNDNCVIGENVTLYSGVCIGWKGRGKPCPIIGDNVFIGVGTNVIGDVHIGDNVIIGQNCVIVKDVEAGTTLVAQTPRKINQI